MEKWMREGVYAMTGGPNYETDAEVIKKTQRAYP